MFEGSIEVPPDKTNVSPEGLIVSSTILHIIFLEELIVSSSMLNITSPEGFRFPKLVKLSPEGLRNIA